MTQPIIDASAHLQRLSQWWTATPAPTAILTVIGFLTVAKTAYSIYDFVSFFLAPSTLHRYLHSGSESDKQPAWALVTGATDGIGKAFAHELAAAGFNVVLHGRNPTKLEDVQAEMRAAHPAREFRTLRVDASRVGCVSCLEDKSSGLPSSAVDFDSVVASLSDIHLTVFVSNAGGGLHPAYRTLDEIPAADITSNVSVNALFPLHLLSALLPTLGRNSPALVIVMGSLADNGLPYLSSYGPSKSFLMSLAGCVARDLRLQGCDVEVIGMRCGAVTEVAHQKAAPSFAQPSARTFARAALGRVGCGQSVCIPYVGHALQQSLGIGLMPSWLKERVFMGVMKGLRDEERAKLAKEGKGE